MKKNLLKKIRRYIVYVAVLIFRCAVSPLSFGAKSGLGAILGFLSYLFLKKSRNIAMNNVRRAFPGIDGRKAESIVRESFKNMGRNILEAIHLEGMSPAEVKNMTEYEGLEKINEAMKEGKGVIVITGHIGNWEFFQSAMSSLGYSSTVLAQRYSNPYIDKMITKIRNASGTKVIIRRRGKERELMKGVLSALSKGDALGILMDHYTKKGGLAVPFLKGETSAPAGPALFAMRTGAPVIFGYAMRMREGKFKVKFTNPLKIVKGKNRDVALAVNTSKFIQAIEDEILNYPRQWAWMHKFARKHRKGVKRVDYGKLPKVVIYSKKECCLCDEAKDIIKKISHRFPLNVEEVNISDDEEKMEKYGREVPVIFIEGKKLFKLKVEKNRFQDRIAECLYNLNSENA